MRFLASFLMGLVLAGWVVWRAGQPVPRPAWAEPGYKNPILAFEFARTPEKIRTLFAVGNEAVSPLARTTFRHRMRHAVVLDALFLFLYAGFLVSFSLELGRYVDLPVVGYLGAGLALFVGYCDVLENEQLFVILDRLDTGRYTAALRYLTFFTGLKWGALPLLALTWLPALWRLGTVSRVLFVVAGTVGVLGFAFWLPWERPEILEVAAVAFALLVLLLLFYAGLLTVAANRPGKSLPTWL
jgi:hypothetical protein